jgi:predicted metal-dependent HD superfamily phosphohydrolase
VTKNATWLANEIGFTPRQRFVVIASTWFHDIGYLSSNAPGHEEQGVFEALKFLEEMDQDILEDIKGCVMATKMPQAPKSILEKIICYADLFHLGTSNFPGRNMLMRMEYNRLNKKTMSKKDWRKESLKLLKNHIFHTDICFEKPSRAKADEY